MIKYVTKKFSELLGNLGIFENVIKIIENIYWEETACIQVEKEFTKVKKNRNVSKIRIFLLSLYTGVILSEIEVLSRSITEHHHFSKFNHTDNTVLIEDKNETTVTPRKSIKLKTDGMNKHKLQEDIIYVYTQKQKPRMQIRN